MDTFSLTSTLKKGTPKGVPFREIKERVLGKKYDLSLVLCGDSKSRRLNRTHRSKDYATNVLSFPLDDTTGEIFLNIRKAEREAKKYNHSTKKHIVYLLIHGMLHLKGFAHGSTMESEEVKILKHFGF